MSWKAKIATVVGVIVLFVAIALVAEGNLIGLVLLVLVAVAVGVLAARAGSGE